jgi:deoxyribose-phosphate aldolase
LAADELARFIDHAVLAPNAGAEDVARACAEARDYQFRGLVVPTCAVSQARRLLRGTEVQIGAVVSFPHGTCSADIKAYVAQRAIQSGADEIDYVISVGAARDGDFRYVREEAVAIVRAVHGRVVKAILEIGYLTADQMVESALRLCEAGVTYVKTCTGFGPGEATEDIVRLLAQTVGDRAFVKASGGIRDRDQAIRLLHAGAAVIGTSRGTSFCTLPVADVLPGTEAEAGA